MKKYYAYVAKDISCYYENKLAKHGAIIVSRELIRDIHDNELYYYYVIEAKDGIIDPRFELKGA